MRDHSYENEFYMQFHFHANQTHFHKNGFAPRLALKQRHKGTRKWPIGALFFDATIITLKMPSHGILSYFEHRQNYR